MGFFKNIVISSILAPLILKLRCLGADRAVGMEGFWSSGLWRVLVLKGLKIILSKTLPNI